MANPTRELLDVDARKAILKGVKRVFDITKTTLGPNSASVLMYRTFGRGPRIVDDGHTIAQVIEPKNEFEKIVVDSFKEMAAETNKRAGDGTTGTQVVGATLINQILSKVLETSLSFAPSSLRVSTRKISRELLKLSKEVQEKVKAQSKKVENLEELEKIAVISLGDEALGKIVAGIVWEVGVDSYVDVVEGYKGEVETEVIKGTRFAAKPGAKAFVNNQKKFELVAEDSAVLLTNYKLENIKQFKELSDRLLPKNKKIIILSPDFSPLVLTSMFQTAMVPTKDGGFIPTGYVVFPVKVPSLRTEQFDDLSIYFGAKFINKDLGMKLENVTELDLGFVQKLVVKDTENREDAIAIGGRGSLESKAQVGDKEMAVVSPVSERIQVLKAQIAEERIDSHKKLLERRIASLGSAVGVIRVGASTTAESLPLKLKVEDAQYACKSALEEGYVKGGGLCLKEIAEGMEVNTFAEQALVEALKAPYNQIQENNEEPLEIGDEVIDPTKVVRLIVEHAISVAANLITCKSIVVEENEETPGDGYIAIAKALNRYNNLFARKEGMIKENEEEMLADNERLFEQQIANDNG